MSADARHPAPIDTTVPPQAPPNERIALYERIYKLLLDSATPVTNKVLQDCIGVRSNRILRATGRDPGLIERCAVYFYEVYGAFLIRSADGFRVTFDPDLAEKLIEPRWRWAKAQFDNLSSLKRRIELKRTSGKVYRDPNGQLRLVESGEGRAS